MRITAVIMAGGKGERFWPRSRRDMPKQFLSLTNDGKTMIQHTVSRIGSLVDIEDVFVVTNREYKKLVIQQLQGIPEENILLEPIAKNTAPCIGLAAVHIKKKYEDAIMIVLPSDHLIKYNELFIDTLRDSVQVAEEANNLVTIGIMPSYPETGYGYINFGSKKEGSYLAYEVSKFVEKPSLDKAKEYLATGKYLWNSGMFVWKVSSIMDNFEQLLPDTYNKLMKIYKCIGEENQYNVLQEEFESMIAESIDYGIMEHASNIYTFPGNFGWDDVGSWLAIERINTTNEHGNVVNGDVITIDTKNSIIQGQNKLIATVGIEQLIIVDTEDAMLICAKDRAQDVKEVIKNLKICNRYRYL